MRINVLRLRVDFSWWPGENVFTIKIRPPRKSGKVTGSWKSGYDAYINFLGLRIGFMKWANPKRFDIDISPAYLMCLRSDGSKRIWWGIRVKV